MLGCVAVDGCGVGSSVVGLADAAEGDGDADGEGAGWLLGWAAGLLLAAGAVGVAGAPQALSNNTTIKLIQTLM